MKLKKAVTVSFNQGYLAYSDINVDKDFPFKKGFTIKFDIEIYKMKKSGEINAIIKQFVDRQILQQVFEPVSQ